MKKILIFFQLLLPVLLLTSCIKNDLTTYTASTVEFDASTWNANSAGVTYPILTRVPVPGIVTPSSSPLITRSTGDLKLRINLVGPHSKTQTTFTYKVIDSLSTAVSGTHYAALSGSGVIPADSSFANLTISVLNPGVSSTPSRVLVLQLLDNGTVKANVNYAKVGISISQN